MFVSRDVALTFIFLFLFVFLLPAVIRSALRTVCAIEAMPTTSESRVFTEYKEQWMKRDEVRNMWNAIRSEVAGNGGGGGGAEEGKSNRK